ncbi:MAG: hypothetical protein ACLRWF_01715 [Ruthenibacterium sp.]
MVADKEFYYGTYHGRLPEAEVEGCLARAEYVLHGLTLDRLQDGAWEKDEKLARSVRMAHCALADAQHAQDVAVLAGGKVTSESVGKWSRSIQQDDAQTGSFERRCLRIAAQYIPVRSGLYRGQADADAKRELHAVPAGRAGGIYAGVCPRLLLAGGRGGREHYHTRRAAGAI